MKTPSLLAPVNCITRRLEWWCHHEKICPIRLPLWMQTLEVNLTKSPPSMTKTEPCRKISQRRQRQNRARKSGSEHLNVFFLLPSKKEIAHLITTLRAPIPSATSTTFFYFKLGCTCMSKTSRYERNHEIQSEGQSWAWQQPSCMWLWDQQPFQSNLPLFLC